MNILFIGDIVGKPGRLATAQALRKLKKEHTLDLVIANGENLAHGKGMTDRTFAEMREAGVDFFTTGNHILSKPEIYAEMQKKDTRVLRPENFPEGNIGMGHRVLAVGKKKLLVLNLIGRVFMPHAYDCPFRTADRILEQHKKTKLDGIFVDFHAETTSEKIAMKHYLDGRASVLVGTHTHVPTADAEVTKKGLAYMTDVGMTGPTDSVIGARKDNVIESILLQKHFQHEVAEGPECVFNAVLVQVTGRATAGKMIPVSLRVTL